MSMYPMPKKGLPIALARILIMPFVLTQDLDKCLNAMLGTFGGDDNDTIIDTKYYPYSNNEIKKRLDILVSTIILMKKDYKFYDIIKKVDNEFLYSAISKKNKEYLSKALFYSVIKSPQINSLKFL